MQLHLNGLRDERERVEREAVLERFLQQEMEYDLSLTDEERALRHAINVEMVFPDAVVFRRGR